MSTGLIIAIVVVAIIILALLFLLPRMRQTARQKQAERELRQRRENVAQEHRQVADQRETRAEEAERKARMAEQAAQKERAEAGMRREQAEAHERGEADHELIEDHERDRFANVAGPTGDGTTDADRDGHTADDRSRAATDGDPSTSPTGPTGSTAAGGDQNVRSGTTGGSDADSEYEQGREDERRFERNRLTEDVRESDRNS